MIKENVRQFLLAVNMVDVGAIIFQQTVFNYLSEPVSFLYKAGCCSSWPLELNNKSEVDNYSNWLIMSYDTFKCVTVFLFSKHTFPH